MGPGRAEVWSTVADHLAGLPPIFPTGKTGVRTEWFLVNKSLTFLLTSPKARKVIRLFKQNFSNLLTKNEDHGEPST